MKKKFTIQKREDIDSEEWFDLLNFEKDTDNEALEVMIHHVADRRMDIRKYRLVTETGHMAGMWKWFII